MYNKAFPFFTDKYITFLKPVKHNRMSGIQHLCHREANSCNQLGSLCHDLLTRRAAQRFNACGVKKPRSNGRSQSGFTRPKKERQEATHKVLNHVGSGDTLIPVESFFDFFFKCFSFLVLPTEYSPLCSVQCENER